MSVWHIAPSAGIKVARQFRIPAVALCGLVFHPRPHGDNNEVCATCIEREREYKEPPTYIFRPYVQDSKNGTTA